MELNALALDQGSKKCGEQKQIIGCSPLKKYFGNFSDLPARCLGIDDSIVYKRQVEMFCNV